MFKTIRLTSCIILFTLLMNILFIHLASAQNRSKTHDVYNALTGVDLSLIHI